LFNFKAFSKNYVLSFFLVIAGIKKLFAAVKGEDMECGEWGSGEAPPVWVGGVFDAPFTSGSAASFLHLKVLFSKF
jgi:hypothetical protein